MTTRTEVDQERLDAYLQKVMGSITMGMNTVISALGDQLGLYRSLHRLGRASGAELADATGLDERWVTEWLRHQACVGQIDYDADDDRFHLSPEAVIVLLDDTHPQHFAGGFESIASTFSSLPQLANAFHNGGGLSYDDHGAGCASGIERMTAYLKEHVLIPTILPMIDGLTERLEAGIRVADVGCGGGRALLVLADAFPASSFVGYDTSAHALQRARAAQALQGLDNVRFLDPDQEPLPTTATYELITTFDVVHDVPYPDRLIRDIHAALTDDGVWLCEDIRSLPTFAENLAMNPLAPTMYGFSLLVCLSSGLSRPGGAGLGTLGFNETVARRMTAEAGFGHFRKLPHDNPLNVFYDIRKQPRQ